jgi:16S rRNA (adenine1518-N6/adenine1519-N6)-dimethyltransferase
MSRQTKSYLMARFREMGIRPATRHGQNFLIDLNLHDVIIKAANLDDRDVVLEIGTGTGALTEMMAQRAAVVVTVEIDSHLYELASEVLIDYPHVTMLNVDALRNKNNFNPAVLEAIGQHLAAAPNRRLKLVANLPYNIATPVLSNLLSSPHTPHSLIATIQLELAERIIAQPWSKDYSALSAWIQVQADAEIVRQMAPTVFWPEPKVQSAIIRITVDPLRRAAVPDLTFFHQFTKAIFLHRRKFLRANLVSALKGTMEKPEIDEIIAEMGFADDARTEQIDVPTLLRLTELVRARAPQWTMSGIGGA